VPRAPPLESPLALELRVDHRAEWGKERAEAFRAGVALIRSGRKLTPGPLARGYNKRSFELVARTERQRVARGKPTPQILEDGPAGPGIEVVQRAA